MKASRRTIAASVFAASILLAASGFVQAGRDSGHDSDRDRDRDGNSGHDRGRDSGQKSGGDSVHGGGRDAGLQLGAEYVASSCSGGLASVDIDVAVVAGSAAPVTFHVSIAGGPFTVAGTSNSWTSNGRTKAMEETLAISRPANGLGAQVWICAAQPGSNGNDSRSACAAVMVPGVLCSGGDGGPL